MNIKMYFVYFQKSHSTSEVNAMTEVLFLRDRLHKLQEHSKALESMVQGLEKETERLRRQAAAAAEVIKTNVKNILNDIIIFGYVFIIDLLFFFFFNCFILLTFFKTIYI